MTMYYYRVFTKTNGAPIKTSIGPDINLEQAIKILHNTYDTVFDTTDALVAPITDPAETSLIDEQLPIRVKGFKAVYYINGNTADRTTLTLVRYDPNGEAESYADIVTMPRIVAEQDCSGYAARELLIQIAQDYWATDEGKTVYPDGIEWNDIVNLPEAFLEHYGVTIDPVDTFGTIDVDMNMKIAGDEEE